MIMQAHHIGIGDILRLAGARLRKRYHDGRQKNGTKIEVHELCGWEIGSIGDEDDWAYQDEHCYCAVELV